MILYHGSNLIIEEPIIVKTKYTKDFGWGFYTTENRIQAEQWARRKAQEGGIPSISAYEYMPDDHLRILEFPDLSDSWLDMISLCRGGGMHDYDIVSGPMADDKIWNYVEDYLSGALPKSIFLQLAAFQHPTQQTSFHTARALATLCFLEGTKV